MLQVGSMDGVRAIRLLQSRADLELSGLEIEPKLVDYAVGNVRDAGLYVEFVIGDITVPPPLPAFDFVVCLNHTLGYISDETAAINGMKSLGKEIIVSVYGEMFDDDAAHAYFDTLKMPIVATTPQAFRMHGDWSVKRYSRADVDRWNGEIVETPLGY